MRYTFETEVAGIPCQCRVTYYYPGSPMVITGSGFGDAIAPEPEEFDFELLDEHGNKTQALDEYLDAETCTRLRDEYLQHLQD